MPASVEKILYRLETQITGRVSRPGDEQYTVANAIWAKPVDRTPRAVVHCRTPIDIQSTIRAARDANLPLSVRGGGHDWAGRALCDGIVIDLSDMNSVVVDSQARTARVSGGARASNVLAATDSLGLTAVTGSVGAVGMAGLTLGGGYGPLIGRFGLALDNLLAAEVVLADGRIVAAGDDHEEELFWALRGGGGNFGVVTAMELRLHDVPSVHAGMLIYPFSEAKTVLERGAAIAASASEALTVQFGVAVGPDGVPLVMVVPTWCGRPEEGEAQVAPFLKLGTLLDGAVDTMSCGTLLTTFDPFIVNGQRVVMETCWIPAFDGTSIDVVIEAIASNRTPGYSIFTHAFTGAAARVPVTATAFGLRREHVLVEIIAVFAGQSDKHDENRHRQWAGTTLQAFNAMAFPGGYPNLLTDIDPNRVMQSYGPNAERLIKAKYHYDPDGVFRSAIPLPGM